MQNTLPARAFPCTYFTIRQMAIDFFCTLTDSYPLHVCGIFCTEAAITANQSPKYLQNAMAARESVLLKKQAVIPICTA